LDSTHSGGGSGGGAPFHMNELLATPRAPAGDESAEAFEPLAKGDDYDDDGCVLFQKSELRAHAGAVYTAKFSPSGRLLASGALDCKVLLWDVTTKFNQQQVASLAQHSQLVIDVRCAKMDQCVAHVESPDLPHRLDARSLWSRHSWSLDSAMLASASYDHTVKLWDVDRSQLLRSSEVAGLVQCVSFNLAGAALSLYPIELLCAL
jgi:WD40 repeat protein